VHKPSNLTDSSTNTYEQFPNYKNQGIRFRFKEPVEMNCIAIQEMIQCGQRIQAFEMILENNEDMNLSREQQLEENGSSVFLPKNLRELV
jgi:hypothetical protein